MKRVLKSGFLLVGIAALLFLCACGGQGRFSGNADKLLQAYLEKIEAEGYKYTVYHENEQEEDDPELWMTSGSISGPYDGFSGTVYVQIEETEKGVRSASLGFDPDAEDQNIDQITYLAGTLMQICDASNGSGKTAAIRQAKAVVAAADHAQNYEKNGCVYSISLYSSGIDFEAVLQSDNYTLSPKELAAAQGRAWSDLGLSKSDFVTDFNAILSDYGYSLKDWNASYGALDLERNDLLAEKPEIFALAHKAGFVDGALLLYCDGETIYRVELVETSNYAFYLSVESEAKLLISYFDAAIQKEPAEEGASQANDLMEQISKAGSLTQNGIAYSYKNDAFDKIFTVEAAQP